MGKRTKHLKNGENAKNNSKMEEKTNLQNGGKTRHQTPHQTPHNTQHTTHHTPHTHITHATLVYQSCRRDSSVTSVIWKHRFEKSLEIYFLFIFIFIFHSIGLSKTMPPNDGTDGGIPFTLGLF